MQAKFMILAGLCKRFELAATVMSI